jgi:hypothetical protein
MWGLYRKTDRTKIEADTIDELQDKVISLELERRDLKEEVEDLKLKKKTSEEDIKHMVKMKEERLAIDHERKALALEKEKEQAIATVKDKYRDKTEAYLNEQIKRADGMYAEILERLPNINVNMKGKV